MRLSRERVEQRKAFVTEFFKSNPTATGQAVNEEFKKKGEPAMNLATVYQIRKTVTTKTN